MSYLLGEPSYPYYSSTRTINTFVGFPKLVTCFQSFCLIFARTLKLLNYKLYYKLYKLFNMSSGSRNVF